MVRILRPQTRRAPVSVPEMRVASIGGAWWRRVGGITVGGAERCVLAGVRAACLFCGWDSRSRARREPTRYCTYLRETDNSAGLGAQQKKALRPFSKAPAGPCEHSEQAHDAFLDRMYEPSRHLRCFHSSDSRAQEFLQEGH